MCPVPLTFISDYVELCGTAGISEEDRVVLTRWKTPGVADWATLICLKRVLDAHAGKKADNLVSFLRRHNMKPMLENCNQSTSFAVDSRKEDWRDKLRARQQHRDYQHLVSDLRKAEDEQVRYWACFFQYSI